MEQIAGECGVGLVSYTMTHHTRQSAIGLPVLTERQFAGKEYTVIVNEYYNRKNCPPMPVFIFKE